MRTATRAHVAVLVFAGWLSCQALASATGEPSDKPGKGEGARITVGKREYAIRFLRQPVVGDVESSRSLCLWKDGTAWVIDPLRPDLEDRFACPWPIETL